ncbi:hypothetical protein OOT33_03720 [Sphingobium sp. DEHP117]|uniref:hypothetical protein n=1 Tax=Sphingobium sp. DEHP117 TaxID=2993436 RepID=UPI0027D75C18|nr:hypothetical protein [Sphingobium sp. DEHP117]MDQ4419547.1 hypothetical protein [Sphingobium sp. DEHP117]
MGSLGNTLVVSNGGRVITLPANSTYNTPAITFYDVPLSVVQSFVRPIENSPSTAIFRQALAAHAAATWTGSPIEIRGKNDLNNDNRAYAQTTNEPSLYLTTNIVLDSSYGISESVDLIVPKFTTAKIDVFTGNLNDWTSLGGGKFSVQDRTALGFISAADFAASAIWHELGHIYVREFSHGLRGHGEVAKKALSGTFNGIQAQDILGDDVFRAFQLVPSAYGGYFSDNGSKFLSAYANTFDRMLSLPSGEHMTVDQVINNKNIFNGSYSNRTGLHPNNFILVNTNRPVGGDLKDSKDRW